MGRDHRVHVEPRTTRSRLPLESWPVVGRKPFARLEDSSGATDRRRRFRPRGTRGKEQHEGCQDNVRDSSDSHSVCSRVSDSSAFFRRSCGLGYPIASIRPKSREWSSDK